MTHRFPPEPLRDAATLDLEDVNANFQAVQEELLGQLGEHNFAEDAFADRVLWADDIALRLHHDFTESDCHDGTADGNDYDVPQNGQWSAVSGCSVTLDSFGAVLWCLASFQVMSAELGLMVALRIDGVVDVDSIWGGAEDLDVEDRDVDLESTYKERRSPGAVNLLDAGVCETLSIVPPGTHTVEVVARTVGIGKSGIVGHYRLYHRELIVLEMDSCP